MRREGIDDDTLAQKALVTRSTISRLRRRKARPSPLLSRRLFELSDGEVTPNDYEDLPELSAPDSQRAA
jgi:hypothetical protein